MDNIKRRNFIKWSSVAGLAATTLPKSFAAENAANAITSVGKEPTGAADRKYWLGLMEKIAAPVLNNLSEGTLRTNMPLEVSKYWDNKTSAATPYF